MKKKWMKAALSLLLFLVMVSSIPLTTCAEVMNKVSVISTANADKYNIVLLIDKSGSMNRTDKAGLAKSAACQFIDQLCNESNKMLDISSVTKVGVMEFAQSTTLIRPITALDNETNRDDLKEAINNIRYLPSGTGGTDISVAVNNALQLLEKNTAADEKSMVVVFTDGYSENVKDKKVSEVSLANAFALSEQMNTEVYIVGMNSGSSIKDSGQQEIYYLADNTQRSGNGVAEKAANDSYSRYDKVNYLITGSINDVVTYYGKIVAKMIGSELELLDGSFIIDDSSIIEADITVFSGQGLYEVKLIDPDGNEKLRDGKTLLESGDEHYKVLKLINPAQGEWKIAVKAYSDDYVSYLLKVYGIDVAITAEWDSGANFSESGLACPYVGKVSLNPMFKGSSYVDETMTNGQTTAEITVAKGDVSSTYSMNYKDGKFVGYFPVEQGSYDITAHIISPVMDKNAECKLTVTNAQGNIDIDLGRIKVKNLRTIDVDMETLTKTQGIIIQTFTVDPDKNREIHSDVSQNGQNVLTVKGLSVGDNTFTVNAIDSFNMKYIITGSIDVVFAFTWVHVLLLAAVLALLGSILLFVLSKLQRVPGEFSLEVTLCGDGEYAGEDKEHDIIAPYGKSFSLWKLVDKLVEDIETHSDSTEGEREIASVLNGVQKEISKGMIRISSVKRGSGVKKTYCFINRRKKSQNLASVVECYRDKQLSIKLQFRAANEFDDEEDNDDWGKTSDYKKKSRSKGRKASTSYSDDYE